MNNLPLTDELKLAGSSFNMRVCGIFAVVQAPITFSLPASKQAVGISMAILVTFLSLKKFFSPVSAPNGFKLIKSVTSSKLTTNDSLRCPTNTLPAAEQPGMLMAYMCFLA